MKKIIKIIYIDHSPYWKLIVAQLLKKFPTFVKLSIPPLNPNPVQFNPIYSLAVFCLRSTLIPSKSVLWCLRFLQRWLWRFQSFVIHRRVVRWESTDVSERHIASIFSKQPAWSRQKTIMLRWKRHIPPKRRLILNGLHDDISQKTQLF
jgi:hypothetical protein